jgi:hypothetical protein
MKLTVLGLTTTDQQLDNIVDALRSAGFRNSDISILMPDKTGLRDLAHEKHSKAPEGTATGAAAGALLGGALGWLTGIGTLVVPGMGPFVIAGPLVAALSGIGLGSTIGGVTGGLIGLGLPEYEAKQYESKLVGGNMLISVHSDDQEWATRAEDILEAFDAKDVMCASEAPVTSKV